MNIKKISELHKICKEGEFKHVSLCNSLREPLIQFNSKSNQLDAQIERIGKRLSSTATAPGLYYILIKANQYKHTKPEEIIFTKEGGAESPSSGSAPSPIMLTYEKALELQTSVNTLQFKVDTLTKENEELHEQVRTLQSENDRLERELEEIEKEEEEEQNQQILSEAEAAAANRAPWWSELAKEAIPAIKGIFESFSQQNEEKIKLQKMILELQKKRQQPPIIIQKEESAPQQMSEGSDPELDLIREYYGTLRKERPDVYQQILSGMSAELNGIELPNNEEEPGDE